MFDWKLFEFLGKRTSHERYRILVERLGRGGYEGETIEDADAFGENLRNFHVRPRTWVDGQPLHVFLAHYDVVCAHSENTIDNTAALVLLERLFREARFDPNGNPLIVFTDGEERGAQGSRLLASHLRRHYPDRVAFILNLDVVGHGADILIENIACRLGQVLQGLGAIPFPIPFNDAVPLRQAGFEALCLSNGNASGHNPFWRTFHSPDDNGTQLQPEALERAYRAVLALAEGAWRHPEP